jgi:hypothetical protein
MVYLYGCPFAVKNRWVILTGVRVYLSAAAGFVGCLTASDAILIAAEVFQYFPNVYRLAVVS